jgi:hypothetical protein
MQKLSANKLQAAIDAQDKIVRNFVDIMIDSGRGHERMSEVRESAARGHDSLAWDYIAAVEKESALNAEKARRLRYHGKMSPIKVTA